MLGIKVQAIDKDYDMLAAEFGSKIMRSYVADALHNSSKI
ncbi:hypothetical protein CAMGR0001_2393 [Campylobacter gracilis RM3268]|uniref:Uncharacterized protein n=1 Tax=Campylobacter gracilis RM3268 TaxID=553220 RepID=C8PE43_9BACT|nr:hypothetical protein CAMGR0001_2393 [Campylobacter gracilis RM3268]